MNKSVIGVSQAMSAARGAHPWQERLFFGYEGLGRQTNPAIMARYVPAQSLDAADTAGEPPTEALAGIECVSILLQGELHSRDSTGQDMLMKAGDILWQGAGNGMLRQLRAGPAPGRPDAPLELLTLWINLPAAAKQLPAHHQALPAGQIPEIGLPGQAGKLRLIAGEWQGQLGPAETVQPLQLWQLQLNAGHETRLALPQDWYGLLMLLQGRIMLDGWPTAVNPAQLVLLDRHGSDLIIQARQDSQAVLLSCEPLTEPMTGRDGIVMNSSEQLQDSEARLRQMSL